MRTIPIVLLLSGLAQAQQPAASEREWPSTKLVLEQNIEYTQAGGKPLMLGLYTPRQPKQPVPLLVWLHPAEGRFAGRYPNPVARLVGNEYAVASIDYRPGQLEDGRAAIRWLRANAAKYSIDPAHIGVWGFREGARMAALLGAESDPATRVQAVVVVLAAAGAAPRASKEGPPYLVLSAKAADPLYTALRNGGVEATERVIRDPGSDFLQLRRGENAAAVEDFLDKHLKGGARVRYWLGKIDPTGDAWVDPIIDEPEGTRYKLFSASALGPGRQASYLVYLPPTYEKETTKRFPVIYYLHGGGGSQRVGDIWVQKLDAAIRQGTIPPAIAVLVEGLPDGRYLDSEDGKRPIESVFMKDLVPHIDATYRTIARREARALEGLSMGGYGSFHLGFKYPEQFGMISGLCNGLTIPGAPPAAGRPPATPADLAANPFTLAERNLAAIKARTAIRIVVGTEDFTLAVNEAFHSHLTKLGIPHEYRVLPNVSHGYKEYYERHEFGFFKAIATR